MNTIFTVEESNLISIFASKNQDEGNAGYKQCHSTSG